MDYIHKLIAEGEHQQLDFKFEISDARKIARTMVAFANTDGGRLLIGVKDNGAIAGVRSEEEIFMLEGAADLYCRPPVKFEARRWEVNSKTILEAVIIQSRLKPHYAQDPDGNWVVYIRSGDQNFAANRILLKVWERQKEPAGTTVKFSRIERFLLTYLQVRENITFSGICRAAKVPSYVAEKVLVNLVSLGIIEMQFTGNGVFYRLGKKAFE